MNRFVSILSAFLFLMAPLAAMPVEAAVSEAAVHAPGEIIVDVPAPVMARGISDQVELVSCAWTATSSPAGSNPTFADPSSCATTFTADVAGDYEIQVVASDSLGDGDQTIPYTIMAVDPASSLPRVIVTPYGGNYEPLTGCGGTSGASRSLPGDEAGLVDDVVTDGAKCFHVHLDLNGNGAADDFQGSPEPTISAGLPDTASNTLFSIAIHEQSNADAKGPSLSNGACNGDNIQEIHLLPPQGLGATGPGEDSPGCVLITFDSDTQTTGGNEGTLSLAQGSSPSCSEAVSGLNCDPITQSPSESWYIVIKLHEGLNKGSDYDDIDVFVGPGGLPDPMFPPTDYAIESGPGLRDDMVYRVDLSDVLDVDPTDLDACHQIAAQGLQGITCEGGVLVIDLPDDPETGEPREDTTHTFGDDRGIVLDKFHVLLPSAGNVATYPLRSDIDRDGSPDYLELTTCDSNPTRPDSNCQVQDDDETDSRKSASEEAAQMAEEEANKAIDLAVATAEAVLDTVQQAIDGLGSVDSDDDNVPDLLDNCPDNPNPSPGLSHEQVLAHPDDVRYWFDQPDMDQDGVGDACDDDIDGDGLLNDDETNVHGTDPYRDDTDEDGLDDKVEVDGYEAGGWTVTVAGVEATHDGRGAVVPAIAAPYDILSTDPLEDDADGDGLLDGAERAVGSNPNPAGASNGNHDGYDTDGDGLSDGEEDRNGDGAFGSNEPLPTDQDTDSDGLADDEELAGGLRAGARAEYRTLQTARPGKSHLATFTASDPTDADSDNDGLDDGEEVIDGWEVTTITLASPAPGVTDPGPGLGLLPTLAYEQDADSATQTFWVFSDPETTDSDGATDVYDDDDEKAHGTDPTESDTDLDGVPDNKEDKDNDGVVDAGESDPLDADSDNDSYKDGEEDSNASGACDNGETCAYLVDSDNDGLHDFFEKEHGWTVTVYTLSTTDGVEGETTSRTVHSLASKEKAHTDGSAEGWNDGDEYKRGSDPASDDTDGDGLKDNLEWGSSTDDPVSYGDYDWLDADRDDDRIEDSGEDANKNGLKDAGETDPDNADTDGDLVNDFPDNCPLDANPTQADFDGDGRGDACTDTDGDGLQDDQEDKNGDGVVDPDADETDPAKVDTDGDGFSDYEETRGVYRGDVLGNLLLGRSNPLGKEADLQRPSDPTDPASTPLTPTPVGVGYPSMETFLGKPECQNPTNWPTNKDCRDGPMPDVPVEEIVSAAEALAAAAQATAEAAAEDAQARAGRTVVVSEDDGVTVGIAPTGLLSEGAKPLVYVTLTAETEVFIWRDGDGDGQRGDSDEVNPCTGANCLTFFASLLGDLTEEACGEVDVDCALDDSDGDGYSDDEEAAAGSDPEDPASTPDDVDADGRPKDQDADDNDPSVQDDADGDGVDDSVDVCPGHDDSVDTDGDGLADGCDAFPNDSSEWSDSDSDAVGDNSDVCPGADDLADTDPADGTPDCYADDADGDGVANGSDNCSGTANTDQADQDTDGVGDACDDSDGDGLTDYEELNHVTVSGGTETDTLYAATYPNDADSDDDGLSDGEEVFGTWNPYGGASTDPNDADTDDDGLTDSKEVKDRADPSSCDPCDGGYGSDPNDADTDDDGITDNERNAPHGDLDGDGYTNAEEDAADSDPKRQSSTPDNKDGDLLTDEEEQPLGPPGEQPLLTDTACEVAEANAAGTGTYLCRDHNGDYRLYVGGIRIVTIQDDNIVAKLDEIRAPRDNL